MILTDKEQFYKKVYTNGFSSRQISQLDKLYQKNLDFSYISPAIDGDYLRDFIEHFDSANLYTQGTIKTLSENNIDLFNLIEYEYLNEKAYDYMLCLLNKSCGYIKYDIEPLKKHGYTSEQANFIFKEILNETDVSSFADPKIDLDDMEYLAKGICKDINLRKYYDMGYRKDELTVILNYIRDSKLDFLDVPEIDSFLKPGLSLNPLRSICKAALDKLDVSLYNSPEFNIEQIHELIKAQRRYSIDISCIADPNISAERMSLFIEYGEENKDLSSEQMAKNIKYMNDNFSTEQLYGIAMSKNVNIKLFENQDFTSIIAINDFYNNYKDLFDMDKFLKLPFREKIMVNNILKEHPDKINELDFNLPLYQQYKDIMFNSKKFFTLTDEKLYNEGFYAPYPTKNTEYFEDGATFIVDDNYIRLHQLDYCDNADFMDYQRNYIYFTLEFSESLNSIMYNYYTDHKDEFNYIINYDSCIFYDENIQSFNICSLDKDYIKPDLSKKQIPQHLNLEYNDYEKITYNDALESNSLDFAHIKGKTMSLYQIQKKMYDLSYSQLQYVFDIDNVEKYGLPNFKDSCIIKQGMYTMDFAYTFIDHNKMNNTYFQHLIDNFLYEYKFAVDDYLSNGYRIQCFDANGNLDKSFEDKIIYGNKDDILNILYEKFHCPSTYIGEYKEEDISKINLDSIKIPTSSMSLDVSWIDDEER